MLRAVLEIFLHEPRPEGSPGHLFFTGLHQLLHSLPPVFSVCDQEECDEG